MHQRLSFWMVLFAFVAASVLRAQAPANAAPAAMPPGQIQAKMVKGSVSVVLNGVTTALRNDDFLSQSATVVTAADSSVILLFSNGASTQLGADTSLKIEEFLQDPFTQTLQGEQSEEPTTSHTRLNLQKGELVGKVAHLHIDKGSTFTVQTPVGAAGIRGTVFRIVFRPSGTGQAFAVFALSTLEGQVNYEHPQGGPNPPPQGPGQGQPGGTHPGGGVSVPGGQEVVVTVSVDVNPTTGQVTITAPVTISSTTPLNPVTRAEIASTAVTLATTTAAASFTPPSTGSSSGGQSSGSSSSDSSSSSSSSSTSSSSTSSTQSTDTTSGGQTSGSQSTGSTSGTGTPSGSGTGQQGGNPLGNLNNNPSPGTTSTPPPLTGGAGTSG